MKVGVLVEQIFDLKELFPLDSLHDQRICSFEQTDNEIIFHISPVSFFEQETEKAQLYYEQHKAYKSCDIHFVDVSELSVEVRTLDRLSIRGTIFFDDEFFKYVLTQKYSIEIADLFLGHSSIVIYGTFVQSNGYYGDECIIKVIAKKMAYFWT